MEGSAQVIARHLVGLAMLLVSAIGQAQPPDVQKADALFREGRALMRAGDFKTACPKLEESYRLDPAAGTAVNVGDCNDRFGKVASALRAYQDAEKLLAPGDARIAPVKEQIAALKRRAPRLTITLPPDVPAGTTVTRDGKLVPAEEVGKPIFINPGRTTVVVTSPGRAEYRRTIRLAEGDNVAFDPILGPRLGAENDAPDTGDTFWSPRNTGHVLGGIGAAALTTGIVTGLMANSKQGVVDNNCDANKRCNAAGYDAAQSGKTLTTVSYVGWGIGLVGLAAGGYFLFVANGSEPTTTVGASAGTRGGRVTLQGTF